MKKIGGIILTVFASFVFFVSASSAFDAEDIVVTDVSDTIYEDDFERLVFDFVIPYSGEYNSINALTLENASANFDQSVIDKMELFIDDGMSGYHGLGDDILIEELLWDETYNYYYFDDLDENIPVGGLRIYIAVTTVEDFSSGHDIQLQIPQYNDANSNGVFDEGDKGIFTYAEYNGPEDTYARNGYVQSFLELGSDTVEPFSSFSYMIHDFTYTSDTLYFEIFARDRGGSAIDYVQYGISTDDTNYLWFNAPLVLGSNYYYGLSLSGLVDGQTYYMKTKSVDDAASPNTYTSSDARIFHIDY